MAEPIRLQKFLADAGVASRRASEGLILAGRVSVNGKIIRELGTKIDPENSKVQVDGESIKQSNNETYIAFHKPLGVLSTMFDPEGRPSIGDYFETRNERLFHVGRLDKESEGLILLTNDGDWAQQVSHPSRGVAKKYLLFTKEESSGAVSGRLEAGIDLDDGFARARKAKAIPGGYEVVIEEGRNQILRRMAAALGLTVVRLIRTEVGQIRLGELPVGKWRNLSNVEVISMFSNKTIKQ